MDVEDDVEANSFKSSRGRGGTGGGGGDGRRKSSSKGLVLRGRDCALDLAVVVEYGGPGGSGLLGSPLWEAYMIGAGERKRG